MKNTTLFVLAGAFALVLGMVTTGLANTPPWPVNQQAFFPDGVFNNIAEADCRICHTDPNVVFNGANIPNRHHNLVENPAKLINCDNTAAKNATCPTDNGTMYTCYSCHDLVWNPTTFSYDFAVFRDCLACHKQETGKASVHHLTEAAQTSNCKKCHAPIENPWAWETAQVPPVAKHYIPTYSASMVTPNKALGTGTDDPITPTGHAGRGGCAFCHGPLKESAPLKDTATGIMVHSNMDTHHSTGVSTGPFIYGDPATQPKCTMCHNLADRPYIAIRGCQQCHSVKSLHNIQVDSPNSANKGTIVPGAETPYWGHIGSNTDCNGCHLNSAASAAAPYSGPVIPDVIDISKHTVTAGIDTVVTVIGSAFTNTIQGPTGPIVATSQVVLTAADGSQVTLTPSTISESSMDVIFPATLAAGNYELRVVKGPSVSGPTVVAVTPAVKINSATCSNGIVAITGSGFSQYINATASGTGVTEDGGGNCSVSAWTNTNITANCGTCPVTVNVSSVFGKASLQVTSVPVANLPPVANAGPDQGGRRWVAVKFDGSLSKDPDGTISSYQWNFGDRKTAIGKVVTHSYSTRGTFTVTLKITDNMGRIAKDTAVITIK